MMDYDCSPALSFARENAVEAGRLLRLLRLPVGNGNVFSPMLSAYADLLDPQTTDERQFAACLRLEGLATAHIVAACAAAPMRPPSDCYEDPYRREYRLGEHAARLEICAGHLARAREGFETAGGEPDRPHRIIIG